MMSGNAEPDVDHLLRSNLERVFNQRDDAQRAAAVAELYVAYRRAHEWLTTRGFVVERSLVGNYVTALDMQGFSITLTAVGDEELTLWDAPVETAVLHW